jgi:pyruvate,water dikinase
MTNSLASGRSLGANTTAAGTLRIFRQTTEVDMFEEGDIVYIHADAQKHNDVLLFYELIKQGVEGILCKKIGRTDHSVLLANELNIPCLDNIDPQITDHESRKITIQNNVVVGGNMSTPDEDIINFTNLPNTSIPIKINLGFPEVISAHKELIDYVDGVGFMRMEFLLLDILDGMHPKAYLNKNDRVELVSDLATRIEPVVDAFEDNPVWIRTNDFSVPQLYGMDGGKTYENIENNPMLGWRGIARSIEDKTLLQIEFEALRRVVDSGYNNVGVFPPMTRFLTEFKQWKSIAHDIGLKRIDFGIRVETPSVALTFEEFVDDIEFMIFGSNDLTQFTLAIDRGNPKLQSKYDEKEPAVQRLMERVIRICNDYDIESSIGGEAAADSKLITQLLELDIDSFSVSPTPETVRDVTKHINSI